MALLLKPLLKAMSAGVPFTIAGLYGAGEQGVWYDPSDTTTLFQDSAGTTPVTASGQPVGLMLDKSKGLVRGPELWQAWSSSSFPFETFTTNGQDITSAINTTGFGIATTPVSFVGGKTYLVTADVTVNSGPSPSLRVGSNNSLGLAILKADISGKFSTYYKAVSNDAFIGFRVETGVSTDFSVTGFSIKELPGNHATQPTAASRPIYRRGDSRGVVNLLLNTETLATQSRAVAAVGHTLSFTGAGSITLSGASTAGPLVGTGVNDRVSLTFTPTAGSLTLTVSGSVTKGQLNLGPTALPYQRNDATLGGVATGASTDLHWLETDGVDDGMVTGNIDFTGTDKVAVFAGVRKLSDAATGLAVELSIAAESNLGSFAIFAPAAAGANKFQFRVMGAIEANALTTSTAFNAPVSAVVSASSAISGDSAILRANGAQVASSGTDLGTGSFGNYPLYLFRRGGSSLPFNGWFYGLAITGRLTTDAETVATERFLAAKSAVVIP